LRSGDRAFAFYFYGCVDPVASALHATSSAELETVVAAVIERDGRFLVCQRTRHQTMPLKWEFPGEKSKKANKPATHCGGNWKRNWEFMPKSATKSLAYTHLSEWRRG